MPSPCSPECDPLYSRTISNASSATALRASAPSFCFRLRTGRTCSVPTDACAYQQPLVPCFSNTSVNRLVYSARSLSSTAQSSTIDIGLASPRIDIMILRPCFLTSQICFWNARSSALTTESGWPRSAIICSS